MGIFSDALHGTADYTPRIPSDGELFFLSVSPWDLARLEDGTVVAVVCPHVVRPGVNRVYRIGEGAVQVELAKEDVTKRHRQMVPEDFPVTAWGKKAKGYLAPPHAPTNGPPQYFDIWTKWEQVNGRWIRDVDEEGYMDFLEKLAKWLKPNRHHIEEIDRTARMVACHPQQAPAPAPTDKEA